MPFYTYRCLECGYKDFVLRKIDDRDKDRPRCPAHGEMSRIIEAPRIAPDYPGYTCPITGTWIEGRRAHEENLARHGCRVLEPGESNEVDKRRKAADEALDKSIEATVEQTIHEMPVRKREQLAAELQSGISADVVRG